MRRTPANANATSRRRAVPWVGIGQTDELRDILPSLVESVTRTKYCPGCGCTMKASRKARLCKDCTVVRRNTKGTPIDPNDFIE